MADFGQLKALFLERVGLSLKAVAPAHAVLPADADERDLLLSLPEKTFPLYHTLASRTGEFKQLALAQSEGVLANFYKNTKAVFFRKIDHDTAFAVLSWVHELFRFCELTSDWRYGKKHYELLTAVFQYFKNPVSPYLSLGQEGLMACRMKKEYAFLPENAVFNILPLNILWYQFMHIMNQMGQRYADIKTASVTEGMIRRFQEAFHRGFWDETKGVLRFAWHADSDFTAVSGLGLYALHYVFDDLLYRQKKKAFLKEIWEVYYNDLGIKETARDNRTLRPELLPVYWRAYLKFHGFIPGKKKEVERLVDAHIDGGRQVELLKNNSLYNRQMLEFLAEFRT